jgi:lipoprotein-anchoring transpeptidase ErfK/SrfK
MFFYRGYSLHGTYWHSNFGTPMSHGCVNLSIADAKWLYEWAPMGTKVVSHY